MTGWMIETLLWTAVLIAFVLMVRRPVARIFGPQIAYSLWALPALRLFLPPIELPAWMRPAEPVSQTTFAADQGRYEPNVMIPVSEFPVARSDGALGVEAAATDAATPLTPMPGFDIGLVIELALTVWLIGAAIFLILRFSAYFRLRDELLEGGREVGKSGKVRLVETPGINAPLAFGVIDKVIALPEGFLAQPDRRARDLALAHELAHHKGRDLLVNVVIQPLFAIHWFNPLCRYGWLALRRDQEAACDARVMASAPSEEREAYANLIVSFASGLNAAPNHALTAPMACPVLGEKSIIHRLRSLKMDNTTRSRRLAGRLMLGAAVIALPLTASISYAAEEAPMPPEPPAPPSLAIAPPTPPAAPEPVTEPFPDEAPLVDENQIIVIDPDGEVSATERSGNVFVLSNRDREDKDVRLVFREKDRTNRWVHRIERDGDGPMSEEEIEEIMAEVRESLEEANRSLEESRHEIEKAMEEVRVMRLETGKTRFKVIQSCDGDSSEIATTVEREDGTTVIKLCQARVMDQALKGLREARKSLAESRELSAQQRERALREMDRAIDRWEDKAK